MGRLLNRWEWGFERKRTGRAVPTLTTRPGNLSGRRPRTPARGNPMCYIVILCRVEVGGDAGEEFHASNQFGAVGQVAVRPNDACRDHLPAIGQSLSG